MIHEIGEVYHQFRSLREFGGPFYVLVAYFLMKLLAQAVEQLRLAGVQLTPYEGFEPVVKPGC